MGRREDAGKTYSAVGRSALGRDERPERNMAMAMAGPGIRVSWKEAGCKSNLGQG